LLLLNKENAFLSKRFWKFAGYLSVAV